MSAVAEHKVKITEQAQRAVLALAHISEAADQLDALLYAVIYNEELAPLNSDTVQTAYYTLGQSVDAVNALHVALRELRDDMIKQSILRGEEELASGVELKTLEEIEADDGA